MNAPLLGGGGKRREPCGAKRRRGRSVRKESEKVEETEKKKQRLFTKNQIERSNRRYHGLMRINEAGWKIVSSMR